MFLNNRIARLQRVVSQRFIITVVSLLVLSGLLILPGKGGELAAAPGDVRSPVEREALQATSGTSATNVIVMIGDGMGPEQVEAARYYLGSSLSFEGLPYQSEMTTYAANSSVTDSAAAATAMATGVKVNNGVISLAIPGDSSELPTALEEYKAAGKLVGLVSTAYVSHATPAGWGAHESSRNNYSAIANDLMTQTKPDVLLGGASYVTQSGAQAAGYTVVTDRAGMQAVNTDTPGLMLSGQFGGGGYMPYEYGNEDDYTGVGALPHLSEMTVTALDVLDNDPDGFFIMVEGARIDHAGHSNLIYENIYETIEFGNAVQEVIDWVDDPGNGSDWNNTLLLVTADHETGGLNVTADNGAGNLPTYNWTSTSHTDANVPVYAKGAGAEQVSGVIDNTDIYEISSAAPAQTSFTFAAIGDFGGDTATEGYVADMIAGWNPDFVVTTGDNYYNNAGGSGTGKYDEAIGKYYCSFLEGITTSGSNCPNGTASVNAFFPTLGNHDYSDAGDSSTADLYREYFDLPGIPGNSSGNEWYYDFVQGPVHFFALNSNTQEDDGTSSTSTQANWLQAQLTASTAPWKIVYFHHAPYSTASAHGDTEYMQWPFKDWGVDVVLNGHDHTYERLEKDGVWYFVTGNSGWNLRTSDCYGRTTAATSLFCYDDHYGAMRITATDSQLYLEELIVDDGANGANGGRVIDTLTLPDAGSDALIAKGSDWDYLDNGSNQGTAWQAIAFNDSGWASGPAQLGYGDGDEATVVSYGSDDNNKYITTYFRNTFTVADASAVEGLSMQILRDDGALVYLNGTEVYRSNMTTGAVDYLTTATSAIGNDDELIFNPATIDPGLLVNGDNVIAVEIHQSSVTSTDISFDFELTETTGGVFPPGTGEGTILREWWTGISGTALSALTGDADYPDNPDGSDFPTSFEAPTNWADNYGTRMRGIFHAPVTGQYTFWIASDDNGELYLSSDNSPDNAVLIANVPGWSSSQQWDKYSEQQSSQIGLQAGELYYIEALMKEGGGGDNLAVAWLPPGGSQEVIPGEYLSPYDPSAAVTIDFQDGVAPDEYYAGTRDTYISQNSAGTNYGSSVELLLDGDDPTGSGNDLSTLLKWDTSAIPAGSVVESATVTLDVFNVSTHTYDVYEMKRDWVEGEATWNDYSSGSSWGTSGALGSGDRDSAVLGSVSPTSTGAYAITLNTDGRALVQSWINNSSTNYGLIIANAGSTDGVDIRSSEYGTASSHPKLSITYTSGGAVDVTPPVITLLGSNPLTVNAGSSYNEPGATAVDDFDGDITANIVIDATVVNTTVPGSYSVTYNVSDAAGNDAAEMVRTVNVVDGTAPVITLLGDNPLTLDVGDSYSEPGATADDNIDGDISGSIVIDASAVDTSQPGSYSVTYNVSDAAGNAAAEVVRTVNVLLVDVTPPVITLLGDNPLTVNAGSSYNEPGATAVDDFDGDITANIVIDATAVNTAVPGSYSVTYNVSDAAGNAAAEKVRTVNVIDATAPVITLVGASTVNLNVGDSYIELGATAVDNVDGDLSGDIVIVSTVNTSQPGSYAVTYNVSDVAGNDAAEVVRTVNVVDATAPVITLVGASTVNLNVGDSYIELGATAVDNVDGDLSGDIVIVSTVNTSQPGSYSVTYNVSDAAGNDAAEVVRTVNVVDATAPVITLIGASTVNLNVGDSYIELGATAVDNVDGDLSGDIMIAGIVNTSQPGSYAVTYNVSDAAGNAAAQVVRTVIVVDATAPMITLIGSDPMAVNVGANYVEPGATAVDNVDGDLTDDIVIAGTVNTSVPGSYLVTYDVSDAAGNAAIQVVRTVNVVLVDVTPPVISLLGDNPLTLNVGEAYSEPGATAQDDFDGDISVDIVIDASAVDTAEPGLYAVTYNVSDAAGNAAVEVIRTVEVIDVTAPVITLMGDNPLSLNVGDTYSDPGATAVDNVDGDISGAIAIDATNVDIAVPGSYEVTYNVSDAAGNAASEVVRTVNVVDVTAPVITLLGANPVTLNVGESYSDPGATALDDVDGDISANIVVDATDVNTAVSGSYEVTYNVSDAAGNDAAEVVRTVDVVLVPTGPNVQTGVVTGVGSSSWTTVNLSSSYNSMVVVATANYADTDAPAAVRIRNAAGSSFEVLADSVNGTDSISNVTVHYTVVEEGVYTIASDGVKMEAVKYISTVTDRNGSWVGESRAYNNPYTNPVVVGQVMSTNDADWSVFWARGSSVGNPPSSSDLYVGKMIGEDSDTTRADETIGYIVIEAGQGSVSGLAYVAALGADTLAGVGDSPPYTYGFTGLESIAAAVVSQNGMDGNNGGWAVLYGANPLSISSLALAIDEDQIRDTERNHTTEQAAYIVFGTAMQVSDDPYLQHGVVSGVTNSSWQTVSLDHSYESMIVVAVPNYDAGSPPLVTRLRNTAGSSFEIRVDRVDGSTAAISGVDVHYMVVEEGVYTAAQSGISMEAGKYLSTVTDDNNSWVGESFAAINNYNTPVVLGQVMTYTDTDFSVFWARGTSRSNPPTAGNIYMGKHVAEDPDNSRNDEMIGYIIIEAGSGSIGGVGYAAALGADTVEGITNSPPDSYGLSGLSSASTAVISSAGMDGGNGGWPILYGTNPLSTSALQLTYDEDQLNDSERGHITEQVAYIVFE